MIKRSLRYALTLCRRVLFLLLGLGLLLAVVTWWMAPDINRMRPDIESYLKQEMQLKHLELGRLSWYWAWNIGIRSERCSFSNQDGSLVVRDAQLSVQVSPWQLLFGEISPYKIHLAHGYLGLDLDKPVAGSRGQLPGRLLMDDMTVAWRFGGYQGELPRLGMDFNGSRRELSAHVPGARLQASWDAGLLPEQAELEFSDASWLPQPLRAYVQGQPDGRVLLQRTASRQWGIHADIKGDGTAWVMASHAFRLPFDTMRAEFVVHMTADRSLDHVEISSVHWSYGADSAAASGQWRTGQLDVTATASHIQMPLVWSWLQGLGDGTWRQWLARMRSGEATGVKADAHLSWQQPRAGLPTAAELAAMRYHVSGRVEDADVALGLTEAAILHIRGSVDLDETRLRAEITHAELPHGIGAGQATLTMPWDSTILDLKGKGKADAGRLHTWLDPQGAADVRWGKAPAKVTFAMQWQPEETLPRTAAVQLTPAGSWQVAPNKVPLTIEGGTVAWRLGHGIDAKGLKVHGELLHGVLSFQALHGGAKGWQLSRLQAEAGGDFAQTVQHFHLPIGDPSGKYTLKFSYQGQWQSRLDLTAAGWRNLLGQAKAGGVPMEVRSQGKLDAARSHLDIDHIDCQGHDFHLEGKGAFGKDGLTVSLSRLQTPAFDGSVAVRAPFGADPWEMNVDAVRLDRKALPQELPQREALAGKPWSLHAKLGEFTWDDARMRGVEISLASKVNSIGVFKAKTADIGAIQVQGVSAVFTLPGKGQVDLRSFTAAMGAQKVMLSVMLTPNPEGGMRWRGFAQMEGDFGLTMRRADISKLFSGGRMHALFSGEGEVLRNQPWWQGLVGRLRLRVDDGQILMGGTLSKFLSAISLADLPKLLFGQRKDLTKKGLFFKRLQVEATLHDQRFDMKKLAIRSPAMDMAGHGVMDLENSHIDLLMVVRPFQNIDAVLAKIPLVRDLIGGAAHSVMRKVYHMHGPLADAKVDEISPKEAGLASPGLIDALLNLPQAWFDQGKQKPAH